MQTQDTSTGIVKVDNLLPEEERKSIYAFLLRPGWQFGWKSDPKKDVYSFWHKHFAGTILPDHYAAGGSEKPYDCVEELKKSAPILYNFWISLEKNVLKGHTLVRCYANGQPFGSEGSLHTDSTDDSSFTVVYYPHGRWEPGWGGETLFFNKDHTDLIAASYPRPNRLVMFPGTLSHVARGVARTCPLIRITLMFKTERRVLDDKYRAFLVDQLGVQEVAHSGRDFFTHLSQTYKLLKSWGNPEPVCLAGLFHSIYGTQHFRHEAFSIEKRDVIRELIGEQAEFLAYVFCVTNRPRVFLEQLHSSDLVFTDSHTGEHLRLTNDAFDQLLEIEAANLIEQGGNVRPALEKIAQANISAKAKNAIAQYLAKV